MKMRHGSRVMGTLLVLSLMIAGCASYQAKPLAPGATLSAFESRSLKGPQLRRFLETNLNAEVNPWPPESWDFPMLALVAVYYHPDLQVARKRWEIAKAEKITAGQRPNPSLTFSPQYDFTPTGAVSPWTMGFNFDIPIETAGKRRIRINRAEKLTEAAGLNQVNAVWEVRNRVRSRFLEMFSLTESQMVLREQLAAREEVVKLLEARVSAGETSQTELARSRMQLDEVRLLLADNRRQLAGVHAQLADAMGLPLNSIDEIKFSFGTFNESPPISDSGAAAIRRTALLNRPDILSLLAEYEASEIALQLEIAKQYPDIQLGPGYQWDQGENKWFVGIGMTLPVFNRNEGRIAEAEAKRSETEARFKALQARIVGEIDGALVKYKQSLENRATADSMLLSNMKALKVAEALFASGETDRLDFLLTRLEYFSAKASALESRIKIQQDLGLLEYATRTPLDHGLPASQTANNGDISK